MTAIPPNRPGANVELITISALILGLGALIVISSLVGDTRELDQIITYFSTAVPVILGFAVMQRKQGAALDKTEETRENVSHIAGSLNGKLDARFANLEAKIAEAQIPTGPIPVVVEEGESND